MRPGEWIAIISTGVAIVAGLFSVWVHLETRMTEMQKDMERNFMSERVLREQVLELIKKVNALEGQHNPHHKTPHERPPNDGTMAETYPLGSEM